MAAMAATPAHAEEEDAQALRREIVALRQALESMQQRLDRLEQRGALAGAATTASAAPPAAAPVTPAATAVLHIPPRYPAWHRQSCHSVNRWPIPPLQRRARTALQARPILA